MVEQFGQYWLDEKLGEGDMGAVFKATHHSTPDPLVVKVLNKIDTSATMRRGSAVEVVEVAATLQHPRLHPISEVIELDHDTGLGQLGIAMPFAARRSLADLLEGGKRIPEKAALKIIAQVASALQHLHDMEVAHGSLKPTNILVDEAGDITLTDLSMATLRELGFVPDEPTRQHLLFMPPEREYHSPPEIVGDVFSLGVLTYMLLTGQLPWEDTDPEARGVIEKHDLSVEMSAVLRRELNPQLRFRYPTLADFMLALKEARQGQVDPETKRLFAPDVPPPPPPPDLKK